VRATRTVVAAINQDRRRQATNISYIKTFRDDGAEVFKAIFRRHVAFMLANENVVTLSAIARTKGCEPIVPIIAALAPIAAYSPSTCGRDELLARETWATPRDSVATWGPGQSNGVAITTRCNFG
jgi:hypothetical protein